MTFTSVLIVVDLQETSEYFGHCYISHRHFHSQADLDYA